MAYSHTLEEVSHNTPTATPPHGAPYKTDYNFFSSYHLSGIVIDSFVYMAMGEWQWVDTPNPNSQFIPGTYEKVLYDFAKKFEGWNGISLLAPGSNQNVDMTKSYDCLLKVLAYMIK